MKEILYQSPTIVILCDEDYVYVLNTENLKAVKHNHSLWSISNDDVEFMLKQVDAEDEIEEYEKSQMYENVRELEND